MSDQSRMSRMGASFLPHVAKRVFPANWVDAQPAERLEIVKRRRSIDGPRPDLALQRRWGRATTDVAGRDLHLYTPKSGSTGRVMHYCHGGAFVTGPGAVEWLFAAKVAGQLGFDLALYDYPKVPEHDSTEIHPANLAAYDVIAERYPAHRQVLAGASAGGALALTTMLQLHRAGRPQPCAGLLLSPWLDMTSSHPDIAPYAESDKLLPIECLREDGALYAGPNDPTDALVSPLFMSDDELAALPPLVITVGEHELFLPETKQFESNVRSARGKVSTHIESYGQHVGVITGAPEGTAALDAAMTDLRELVKQIG